MFAFALLTEEWTRTVDPADREAVTIEGRLIDGAGDPVAFSDAFVEVWHADQFARAPTDSFGAWRVTVRRPGRTALPDGRLQAPHMNVTVFARGLMKQAQTRVYFPDEAEANAEDPVLALVEPERKATLVAQLRDDGVYAFDVYLQGDRETVFFDF